jgi:hypothetical protein
MLFGCFCEPEDYDPSTENKPFSVLEKIGIVASFAICLIFTDLTPQVDSWSNPWIIWWFLSAFFLALYEAAWVRFFIHRTYESMYERFLGVPCPLAIFGLLAVGCLAVYGQLLWLEIAWVVMAVGHLQLHFSHFNAIEKHRKTIEEERNEFDDSKF